MIRLLLLFLGNPATIGIRFGLRVPEAVEALERDVVNPAARHSRIAAFCFLTVTGLLAIPAAIVHTIFGECRTFNILGFGALFAAGLCIVCGLRYGQLNRQPEQEIVKSAAPTPDAPSESN